MLIPLVIIFGLIYTTKPYKIMTQSMQKIINPGDVVVTIKSFKLMNLEEGDIVAFKRRGDKTTFVKRICAASGDTLFISRDFIRTEKQKIPHDSIFEMLVNESDHIDSVGYFSSTDYRSHLFKSSGLNEGVLKEGSLSKEEKMVVPEGYYFMVGDNYYESMDSRFWGFISQESIKGKVVWIF